MCLEELEAELLAYEISSRTGRDEEYGRTMYMWYYNDLESNKRGDCLSYSVDVPE